MNARLLFISLTFIIYVQSYVYGQNDGSRPQVWSNLYVNWNINENWSFRNAAAYNVLLWEELPWNEFSYSATAVRRLLPWLQGWGGLYFASTKQTIRLRSTEFRPFLSVRFASAVDKRWMISNTSRLEWRNIRYSTDNTDQSLRFRNRSNLSFSIIRNKINSDRNLVLFSYFEVFRNSEQIVERFFNQSKVKVGLLYRHNSHWLIDIGFIYQDAKNNTDYPIVLPSNIITVYVFDWGVAYIIPSRTKK